MNGIIIANSRNREIYKTAFEGATFTITWVDNPGVIPEGVYDFLLDLEFSKSINADMEATSLEQARRRILALSNWYVPLILIDSVAYTLHSLQADQRFVRINGWNTFLQRPLLEAVVPELARNRMGLIAEAWNKRLEILPDIIGMPSVRIVSMIINEAWYAFGEGVSDKDSIDTAMKLGTNYPKGPFEWCREIGAPLVNQLLDALSVESDRYSIAPLLQQEAICH